MLNNKHTFGASYIQTCSQFGFQQWSLRHVIFYYLYKDIKNYFENKNFST